jgi:hypothetical protein
VTAIELPGHQLESVNWPTLKVTLQAIMITPTFEDVRFWRKVKMARAIGALWFVLWVPVVLCVLIAYKALMHDELPFVLAFALVVAWMTGGYFVGRLAERKVLCPRCGISAFRDAYFWKRPTECGGCGFSLAGPSGTAENK